MKIKRAIQFLSLACLCVLLDASAWAAPSDALPTQQEQIREGSKKYAQAKDWRGKLAACVDLIDSGVLTRGKPIKLLKDLFQTDVSVAKGDLSGESIAFVYFSPQIVTKDASVAVGFIGWYLQVESNAQGNISGYHISNTHK